MAATINDVARRAGVSKRTVSRVLNDGAGIAADTRRRIAEAIAALDYAPDPHARTLAQRRARFDADEARALAALAVAWLAGRGHTRIAFLGAAEDDRRSRAFELGYLDALADHGLDRGAALVAGCDGSLDGARAAAALLLEISPPPGAMICATDLIAAGARQAAGFAGTPVPERLALISCGDTPLAAALWPPLAVLRAGYGLVERGSLSVACQSG